MATILDEYNKAKTQLVAKTSDGTKTYNIGSQTGIDFVNGKSGDSLTGGDGSTWSRDANGVTTINKNGTDYYYVSNPITALGSDGSTYTVGSKAGIDFLYGSETGTMTGADNSVWNRDKYGTTTISKNGNTWTWTNPSVSQQYESPSYEKELNGALNTYNQREFNYDYASDPVYQAYTKQYMRNGQQAMQDTMAAAAANTGGRASSYAVAAGQQAYNSYAGQLSDKIPELYNQAYNRYLQELQNDQSKIALYQQLLSAENSANATAEQTAYEREQAAIEREDKLTQQNYENQQTTIKNLMSISEAYGYVVPELAEYIGVAAGTPTASTAYQNASIQQKQAELQEDARQANASNAVKYAQIASDESEAAKNRIFQAYENEKNRASDEAIAAQKAESGSTGTFGKKTEEQIYQGLYELGITDLDTAIRQLRLAGIEYDNDMEEGLAVDIATNYINDFLPAVKAELASAGAEPLKPSGYYDDYIASMVGTKQSGAIDQLLASGMISTTEYNRLRKKFIGGVIE